MITFKLKNVARSFSSLLLSIIMLLAVMVLVTAETYPSIPSNIRASNGSSSPYDVNMTNSYPQGSVLNGTRGYLYNITINESQPTYKWVGYVGNINGIYALQDASANALYDWTIATVTGEIYATKEGPYSAAAVESVNPYAGGVPDWNNLLCANSTLINTEELRFNHTATEEDRYTQTFMNKTSGANWVNFFAGPRNINDSTAGVAGGEANGCYGVQLKNGTTKSTDWKEVVLTDQTSQNSSAVSDAPIYDLLYASLLKNDSIGFDGNRYDFQILLPQSGLTGTPSNVAFYFYTELI